MPFATHLDGQIEYLVEGSGPPLLLLHGVGGDASQWFENGYVGALSDRFTVIAANSRGYGNSTPVTELEHLPYRLYRDDFVAVMDDYGADQFSVFGYSRGGVLAMAIAMEYPERVTAVIAGASNFGRSAEYQQHRIARANRARRRPIYHPRRLAGIVKRRLRPPPPSSSRWAPVLRKHGIPSWEGWDRYIKPVADLDRAAERITMPALLFQGDMDSTFDVAETAALADRLSHGQLEVIVGADHGVNRRPDIVLPLITPFLLDHAASS
jgi:pimeloyl-ACP methyl ester carboxylesterase